jgi:cytochrome c553
MPVRLSPLSFPLPAKWGGGAERSEAGEGPLVISHKPLTRLGPSVFATLSLQAGRGGSALAAVVLLLSLVSDAFAAGSVSAGRQKATACQTCHGLDGLSKIPDAPNIAGNPEEYLVRQLNAFRKGERKNEMMSIVVQPLSDQDIADLAAYYAAIEVSVKLPAR